MRIVVNYNNGPAIQGAILLLRQLGITWEELTPSSLADVIISEEPLSLKSDQVGIFMKYPRCGKEIPFGVLNYESNEAFYPEPVALPMPDTYETLALIDSEYPGIIQKENAVFVIPAFFEYAARVSVISTFDERFSRTLALDCFREIFLSLLRYCAKLLNRSFVRIWYYPKSTHTGATCCTTDIDHKMTWDILQDLENTTATRAFLSHYIFVKYILRFFNNKVASRYFNKFHYEQLWGKPLWLNTIITSLLTNRTFYTLLSRVYRKGIPITAFVRPSEYQQEENLSMPPKGTGRIPYRPTALKSVELGLHFGASTGIIDTCGKIDNPYKEDVFREGIGRQKEVLEKDIGEGVIGARLHNEFQFTDDIFEFIEKSGVVYDSSVFGGIRRTSCSPSGTVLPYYPVLRKNDICRQAHFVEIPVGVYENGQIPIRLLRRLKLPLIISQHPDSRGSNLIGRFIACQEKTWWRVHLKELVSWWNERDRVRCNEAASGQITLCDIPAKCTVVASEEVKFFRMKAKYVKRDCGEMYYEVERQ